MKHLRRQPKPQKRPYNCKTDPSSRRPPSLVPAAQSVGHRLRSGSLIPDRVTLPSGYV